MESSTAVKQQTPPAWYLSAEAAQNLDIDLMSNEEGGTACHFTIWQLMELAGLSVAQATYDYYTKDMASQAGEKPKVLLICGPGNNGGDGLVAARHLTQFGFECVVYYPKPQKGKELFAAQISQLNACKIQVLDEPWKDH